jgi:hypothetical protein
MDIRLGCASSFEEAAKGADHCYPYLPPSAAMDGEPCAASGLYPVSAKIGSMDPTIARRIQDRGDRLYQHFERRLSVNASNLSALVGGPWRFLSHVSQEHETDVSADDRAEGDAGLAALGGRRWAVIAMDGNDMGRQFGVVRDSGQDLAAWAAAMSKELDGCSNDAVVHGLGRVVEAWHAALVKAGPARRSRCLVPQQGQPDELVIPFRPLVVGGDDIVVLCHAAYAMSFVQAACETWERRSQRPASGSDARWLWPATSGRTTISAGVLFCPVTMPLHAAVPYAEALLASAKAGGRSVKRPHDQPSPAFIDWESVTESVLDNPADRRRRELEFIDGDTNSRVSLTRRPYSMRDFAELEKCALSGPIARLPRSIRSKVLPALRQASGDRLLASLQFGKRHEVIASVLKDGGDGVIGWYNDAGLRSVGLADAIALLEESDRCGKEEDRT